MEGAGRARLAFAYHPDSFEIFTIADAAAGVCDLIWVVDTGLREVASRARLLRRFGEVVDVAGRDVDAAAAAVRAARPDGMLALADELLAWTADVAQRAGLPGNAPATAVNLSDKRAQREALRDGGLLVPGFWPVPADEDSDGWERLRRDAVFPAVVKPRRSQASRHTMRVESDAHLHEVLDDIACASPADRVELQLEQYIPDRGRDPHEPFADYVSVESLVSDGTISHLAITGRFPPAPPFRETGFFMPAALPADERAAVMETASAAVRAVGVQTGFLHTEIKLSPDGPCVLELNGRIGGGVIDMLGRGAGVEVMRTAMRVALGAHVVFDRAPSVDGVPFVLLVQPPLEGRVVESIDGLDTVREHPGVGRVVVNRGPGAPVDWRAGTNEYVALVEGCVADHDELVALERFLRREVDVRYATEDAAAAASGCG